MYIQPEKRHRSSQMLVSCLIMFVRIQEAHSQLQLLRGQVLLGL